MKNRVVIVTIDGWGTNFLGTYGNSLCETPALDHFAAHSVVFDRYISNSSSLLEVLQSIGDGLHPCLGNSVGESRTNDLRDWLKANGSQSLFITDSREVSETEWADGFTENILMEAAPKASVLNENDENYFEEQTVAQKTDQDAWMQTELALFVGEALSELAERQQREGLPELIWLHLSGLTAAWDAPYEYRLALCDEDDPRPDYSVNPISFAVDSSTDFDLIFQAMCAAAGQARIVDHIWSWIEAFIDQCPNRENIALVLAGTRGYPLGEHASVGMPEVTKVDGSNQDGSQNKVDLDERNDSHVNPLHSELLHVPLLIQPGYLPIGYRVRRIVQPTMIQSFMRNWISLDSSSREDLSPIDSLQDSDGDEMESCWVESPDFQLIYTKFWAAIFNADNGELAELYLMPDDRWQQNNVGNRALEIADAMTDLRGQWLTWKQESIQQLEKNAYDATGMDSSGNSDIQSMPTPIACLREPV